MNDIEQQYIASADAALPGANCLPFSLYSDEAVYQLEKAQIFHGDWVFVCAERQLPKPGDYFSLTIAEEPVVVVRGSDEQLRALSNVCRHRGTLLKDEGVGHTKQFVCPYHAWAYQNDGKLIGVPYAEEGEVNKAKHCLPQFALEVWQGLVFVNLDGKAQPLAKRFAPIERYLSIYGYSRFNVHYPGTTEHWQCNWKLAMENAMESYHLFKVHRKTLETVTPTKQAFYLEGGSNWSLTGGRYTDTSGMLTKWLVGEGSPVDRHYVLVSLPPSLVGILSSDSFAWINVDPSGATECTVRLGTLSTQGSVSQSEAEFIATFFAEDKMICERVQKGMRSTHSRGGSLIDMERVVVDFHQYLASRVSGSTGSASTVHKAKKNVYFD